MLISISDSWFPVNLINYSLVAALFIGYNFSYLVMLSNKTSVTFTISLFLLSPFIISLIAVRCQIVGSMENIVEGPRVQWPEHSKEPIVLQ